jgi:phosphoglycerate dehydrogenase-like enzyme
MQLKILTTFIPPASLQIEMKEKFPSLTFHFQEGIKVDDEKLSESEIIITYGEDLANEHIRIAKKLKWVMVVSAGLELMPLAAIEERKILVTNARGIHKIPMAEYTIGMMLQYAKQQKTLLHNHEKQIWDRSVDVSELNGKSMLVLGPGAIGGEIARLAKAFNMVTYGINRSGRPVEHIDKLFRFSELVDALPLADFIISVLPSTKETKGILESSHFMKMKDSAVFINIGRGDLFKDEHLLLALDNNEIAHAILDVFSVEPLPKDHPFWTHKNVTMTPHISSRTPNYLVRSFEIFEQNLREYIKGGINYKNVFDTKRGY